MSKNSNVWITSLLISLLYEFSKGGGENWVRDGLTLSLSKHYSQPTPKSDQRRNYSVKKTQNKFKKQEKMLIWSEIPTCIINQKQL